MHTLLSQDPDTWDDAIHRHRRKLKELDTADAYADALVHAGWTEGWADEHVAAHADGRGVVLAVVVEPQRAEVGLAGLGVDARQEAARLGHVEAAPGEQRRGDVGHAALLLHATFPGPETNQRLQK